MLALVYSIFSARLRLALLEAQNPTGGRLSRISQVCCAVSQNRRRLSASGHLDPLLSAEICQRDCRLDPLRHVQEDIKLCVLLEVVAVDPAASWVAR